MKSSLFITALVSTASAIAQLQALRPTHGRVTYMNNTPYYVGGTAVSRLDGTTRAQFDSVALQDVDIVPFTVIPTSNASFSGATLDDVVADYIERDDVFQEAFLSGMWPTKTRGLYR